MKSNEVEEDLIREDQLVNTSFKSRRVQKMSEEVERLCGPLLFSVLLCLLTKKITSRAVPKFFKLKTSPEGP